jgi:SAM-dependent methyltransferase
VTAVTAISSISPSDSASTHSRYQVWNYVIPLPPESLMWSVGAASVENFLVLGDAWAQLVSHYVPENAAILDIGCGCGRAARVLVNNRWIRKYVGFDVIRENVDWCRRYIASRWPAETEFHWFDLYSREYNPNATLRAQELQFPCDDKEIDVVFAASLFTHLLEPDAVHYLAEIGRVLSPRGTALLSMHDNIVPGERFCGTETRIDIDPAYFVELAARAGLREQERIGDLGGQQVFAFRRAI